MCTMTGGLIGLDMFSLHRFPTGETLYALIHLLKSNRAIIHDSPKDKDCIIESSESPAIGALPKEQEQHFI